MMQKNVSRPHNTLILLVSLLIWGAVSLRWISEFIEQGHPLTWLISTLLALFGVLLLLEPRITGGSAWRGHLYLAFQTALVFCASLLFYELDYFALLFLPLSNQAMFLFERPASTRWVVALILLTFIGQMIQFGGFGGVSYTLLYATGIMFVAAFSNSTRQAEASRKDAEVLLHELEEAHRNLQAYAGQAEELAVANERNRLARDLHDSVAQTLYGLALQAEAAARKLEAGELPVTSEYLRQIQHSVQQTLVETRMLIFDLRPQILEQNGLAAALTARLDSVERRSNLQVHSHLEAGDRLPAQVETNLYRIALEALNNSLKHAHASQVHVSLTRQEGLLSLVIADDGVGFDPQNRALAGSMGLNGMQERAEQIDAQLSIHSQVGQGVQVKVEMRL